MNRLLGRLTGTETDQEIEQETDQEMGVEIPDGVPEEWSGLAPDPVPGARKAGAPLTPKTFGRVTPAMKKKIAEQISMYIDLLAMPVALRDEVCGGAVQHQADALGKAFANILARYPEAAHKFLTTGVLGDWIAVGLAAKPIAEAVWSHHIVKKPEGMDESDGLNLADFDPYRPGA